MYSASPKQQPNHKQAPWFGAYQEIERVAYEILDANGGAVVIFDELTAANNIKLIRHAVDNLYAQHQGDPAWDKAYRLWNETMYYKEDK